MGPYPPPPADADPHPPSPRCEGSLHEHRFGMCLLLIGYVSLPFITTSMAWYSMR